ncbi:MAG: hypothetical protein ACRC0V_00750 [Fusobacteriaceae bacterium]
MPPIARRIRKTASRVLRRNVKRGLITTPGPDLNPLTPNIIGPKVGGPVTNVAKTPSIGRRASTISNQSTPSNLSNRRVSVVSNTPSTTGSTVSTKSGKSGKSRVKNTLKEHFKLEELQL